ncbi:MAG: mandelate racemase [Chloroflexi bacterium]|nr:MAG: mandelate racemase [Chloroflexota bacterium]
MSIITKIEIGSYRYDFEGEFKFFSPDADGVVRRPSVFVRLTDEDGTQGWGQAVPVPTWTYETTETIMTTLEYYLTPVLLGLDPEDFAAIHKAMNTAIKPGFTTGQPLCKAAVDLACFDLVGKRKGKSAAELLGGGKRDKLTLSWTVASPIRENIEVQLENGRNRGYHNFNYKVGYPQTPEYDLEITRMIRDFAPDGFLWADANTGFDESTALDLLPKLADEGVAVIESPLPPSQIRGYQTLKKQGALPIFMDEGIVSVQEAREFMALDMADGLTLKTARSAGLLSSGQIVDATQAAGLHLLGSGLTDPDLSMVASLHLFSYAGIEKPVALNGPQYLADMLIEENLMLSGDEIQVPSGPGLGVTLSEKVNEYMRVVGNL